MRHALTPQVKRYLPTAAAVVVGGAIAGLVIEFANLDSWAAMAIIVAFGTLIGLTVLPDPGPKR